MAGKRPKQFLELAGTPIIFHTLKAFEQCDVIQEIIIVLAADEVDTFRSLAEKHRARKIRSIEIGGATRAQSVWHGLRAAPETTEIVAVHDGVRPFVTSDEIARTVAAAQREVAAILVSSPVDTIKEISDGGAVVRTLRRASLRNALTPQCFRYTLLRQAYEAADVSDPDLTDESSLVERLAVKVVAVEGSPRNIKITRPEDLAIGEAILKQWAVGGGQ